MDIHADETHTAETMTTALSSLLPGWQEGIPLVRLFACGPFTIEVLHEVPAGDAAQAHYAPLSSERLHGRGPAPALTFLKLLTSQPDRYAPKDWLIEHLRGDEYLITPKRLENIVSFVRQLLSLPDGTRPAGMLRYVRASHESGDGYRLAPYPLIWLDVESLAHHVRQACLLERFGDDALPSWERAYQLASRGTYLAEEPYSEWAEVRRSEVEGHLRQCVHALSRLWLARYGASAEEEVLHLLRGYWPRHPEDEDVAWALMDLLGRRGRYQEALDIYARLEQSLEEEGLTKEGQPRKPDQRTRDLADYLRFKERQSIVAQPQHREPVPSSSVGALVQQNGMPAVPVPPMAVTGQEEMLTLFSSAVKQGILQAAGELERGSEGDKYIQKSRESSLQQALSLSSWSGIDVPFDPSRRSFNLQFFQFLCSLTGAATASFLDPEVWGRLLASAEHPSSLNQTSLNAFQDLIEVCWQLCNSGKIDIAEHLLLQFLSSLQHLADREPDAARLTAESLRLLSVLNTHQLKLADKLTQCWQSVHYARLAGEPNTLAACLHELTAALRYTDQPERLFLTFQEALSLCEQLEPPLRAGIYAGAAAAFAQRQRRKEADFYIHLAYEVAQESSARNLALADNSLAHLAEYEGLLFLELDQPRQAYETFDRFTRHSPQNGLPERNRLEMLNYQGLAALRLLDLDRYVSCLEMGIKGALAIDSKKRLQEAFIIYQQIPAHWRDEPRMRQVIERFHLPMGGVN